MKNMKELDYLEPSSNCSEHLLPSQEESQLSSSNLVKDLIPFKKRFVDLPRDYLFRIFCSFFRDTMLLLAAIVGPLLTITSGYIFFNLVGKPEIQGSFGLYSFLYFAFFFSIVISSMEKLGIELSKTIGRKDFIGCRTILTRGAITSLIFFTVVTLPVVLFTEKVFLLLGVDPVSSRLAQQGMTASLPLIVTVTIKELLQAFCMAQGLEHYFGNMGLVTSTIAICLNYIAIINWNLGLLGWIWSRTIASILECAFVAYIYFSRTVEESRGFVALEDALYGFKTYFTDAVRFCLGSYSEYLGFEIAGIFVIMSGRQYETAAYYSVMNVATINFTIGISFSCIARTRLNLLFGMKLYQTAKHFFEFYMVCTCLVGVAIGVLIFLFRAPIASIYASSHPELHDWTKSLLIIMASVSPSETCSTSGQVGLKTVGGINHLLRYSVFTLLLGNSLGGPLFRYLELNVLFPFGWTLLLTLILNILVVRKTLMTDWSSAISFDHEQDHEATFIGKE